MNNGIRKELYSVSYTFVDTIADRIVAKGRGTLPAKLDIKQAYRIVPVHLDNRRLLGMTLGGRVYVDKALPFGLRSAPLIFTAVVDSLQWIMNQGGVSVVNHYLDNFITLGKPESSECEDNFRCMIEICRSTDTPAETKKSVGPTTKLLFFRYRDRLISFRDETARGQFSKAEGISHRLARQESVQKKRPIFDRLARPCLQRYQAQPFISAKDY